MLFLLKITITPVLVALMSLAARRWGPTIGGLVMGLPWMTGPILYFLGLERGEAYAADVAVGVLVGTICIGAYIAVFAYVAKHAPWFICLSCAALTYMVTGYATSKLGLSLWVAAMSAAASLLLAFLITPRVKDAGGLRVLPWWDIPARMLGTAMLVAFITFSADHLGPELSGIVATYPVILTIVATFTHAQWGWRAAVQLARGVSLSLLSFVAFFLVVGSMAESIGLVWSFVLATLAALLISSLLIFFSQRRRPAEPQSVKAAD
ncbi:MAG: hypothetical protein WBB38_12480 [Hyphomicrobiaceae bacterium]|jgi:hypothetical protein